LAPPSADYARLAYDKVADAYDDLFFGHVSGLTARLTRELALAPGERVADLACGTGAVTVDMAHEVAPGEVVGVDVSEGMLGAARQRARDEDVRIHLVHARAEDFVGRADPRSFDVVSMRFVLAYLDWQAVLPRLGRLLRPGGRVGLLTSLSTSVPQFAELYHRFRKSPGPAWKLFQHTNRNLGQTWRIYRQLRETFGEPRFITVPESTAEVARYLAAGGLRPVQAFTEQVRLWFDSGAEAVGWMHDSGYVTHSSLQQVSPLALRFLQSLFAAGMETFREASGVPLDLVVGGVIARRE
jgi:ubiquinone/menaquinone biosynthesis C-methylase UbiE